MASMPWIKLYTEVLDDPKLGRLPDATKWRMVQLFLFAGECDAEGYLVNGDAPMTTADIAWRLRIDEDTLETDLALLADIGVVEFDHYENAWNVTNFSKRQGRSQSEKRAQWRERKRRQRDTERDPDVTDNGTLESVTRDTNGNHAGITALEGEKRESREEKNLTSAGADTPATFDEWHSLVEKPPKGSNRSAQLQHMFETLYPGRDPPSYGYLGKVARQVGGAGRLAELLWQNSTKPPTGDVLAYLQTIAKGGNRATGQDDIVNIQGHIPRAATSEEFYGNTG